MDDFFSWLCEIFLKMRDGGWRIWFKLTYGSGRREKIKTKGKKCVLTHRVRIRAKMVLFYLLFSDLVTWGTCPQLSSLSHVQLVLIGMLSNAN